MKNTIHKLGYEIIICFADDINEFFYQRKIDIDNLRMDNYISGIEETNEYLYYKILNSTYNTIKTVQYKKI